MKEETEPIEERYPPDEEILGLPSRWCPNCSSHRIFSEGGRFCLTCGRFRHDKYNPQKIIKR